MRKRYVTQTGARFYASRITTAKGSTVFYSASDRGLSFEAIDAAAHALAIEPFDACGVDPRLVAIQAESKGA